MKKANKSLDVKEVRHILTYDCILRCKHCYLSAGEHPEIKTTKFTQKEADDFYGFFKPESVSATGGEPLLEYESVKILAKATAKYGGALELVTNGWLLTEDFVKELYKINPKIFFQISLDGNEKFHDAFRQKIGAYKHAIKAIDLTSGLGKFTKARMTVTRENINQIPEIIKLLDSFGRDNISLVMRTALSAGRARDNRLGLGSDMIKKLQKFSSLAKIIKVSVTERCGYCLDSITVDPAGNVFPCCYFVFTDEYNMGKMSNPEALKTNKNFMNYKGKCFAMEKFSQNPPKNRCSECKRGNYLKQDEK